MSRTHVAINSDETKSLLHSREDQSHASRSKNSHSSNLNGRHEYSKTNKLDFREDATELVEVRKWTTSQCKSLSWLTCPITCAEEDAVLPAITVYSEPETGDELELVVHSNGEGTAQVTGHRFVSLRSQGSAKPSIATFDDIRIRRAGLYVIEVRCAANPEISLVADYPITIVPKIESHNPSMDLNLPEECGFGVSKIW